VGNPLEFRDETYPPKTRGMRLPYGESFIIVTSIDLADRTNGHAIGTMLCPSVVVVACRCRL